MYDQNSNPVFMNYTSTTSLTLNVDLRKVLPEWVAVGFSAATGAYTLENHVIKSWEFNSVLDSDVAAFWVGLAIIP